MDEEHSRFLQAGAWAFAGLWILLLLVLFLPLLVVGYFLRGTGTVICNCAYSIRELLELIGNKF